MTETTTEVTEPIVVNSSAISVNTWTVVRYILTALGGLLVTKGYIKDDTLNDIIGILMMVLPAAYGLWETQRNHDIKVKLADNVQNDVAVVK